MIFSSVLKRFIPEGWSPFSLSQCGTFFRGVSYSKDMECQQNSKSIEVLRGNHINHGHLIEDSNKVFIPIKMISDEQRLEQFSILIAMSSGSKEHVGKSAVMYDGSQKFTFGAFCSKFVSIEKYRAFTFCFFNSAYYRNYIMQTCSGTGINNLTMEHFEVPLFALPKSEIIISKFNDTANVCFDRIAKLTEKRNRLTQLRDWLLPMLMNGQVYVRA